jgi:hypothetical protein
MTIPELPPTGADPTAGGAPSPPGAGGLGPPPGGTNVALIVGILVGALLLLSAVAAGALLFVVRRAAPPPSSVTAGPPRSVGSGSDGAPSSVAGAAIELRHARLFKDERSTAIVHLVGELHNPTGASVGFPRAEITLYDAARTAVGSGTCTTVLRVLLPRESVPCTAVFTDVKGAKTFEAVPSASSPLGVHMADLRASDVAYSAPSRTWDPHDLTGRITNGGSTPANSVWAIVGLYDKEGKICGVGSAPVAGNDLGPGASATFKVSIYSVASPVARYVVTPVGHD